MRAVSTDASHKQSHFENASQVQAQHEQEYDHATDEVGVTHLLAPSYVGAGCFDDQNHTGQYPHRKDQAERERKSVKSNLFRVVTRLLNKAHDFQAQHRKHARH